MILDLFREITSIPRCSGTYQPFIDFIKNFALEYDYICKIDDANNILCYKQNSIPNICLQSHYDIVCLEDNTIPQIIEEDGYLKAINSTLGADNGIGCAYMLALMSEHTNCEFLFTCDEEIGLIGANNIQFTLQSKNMLNLDSEEQGHICIGCAGGIDIFAINKNSQLKPNNDNLTLYEIIVDGLDGGHSGVDIDKNIPNAIKLLAKTIKENNCKVLDIQGGQRINSIPKSAKAIVVAPKEPIVNHSNITINKIDTLTNHYKELDFKIIDFLYSFSNGVRGYDVELGVVSSSINLAIIETNIDNINIQLSARSMGNDELELLVNETIVMLEHFGFEVSTSGKYPAWKPQQNDFINKVLKIYKKYIPTASLEAIHAGLECAVFKDKYPSINIASIGPNIYFPHSYNEKCEISSIYKVYDIIKEIIKVE